MLVKAECQQEADAAHPAPVRGRWKRNAAVVIVIVVIVVVIVVVAAVFVFYPPTRNGKFSSRQVLGQGKRETARPRQHS